MARRSGMFGLGGGQSGPWGRLSDRDRGEEDDAFAMAPSANASTVDLNASPEQSRYGGPGSAAGPDSPDLSKRWNPAFAASGESLNWQPPPLEKHQMPNNENDEDSDEKDRGYVKV